jgi:hypothetical protein
MDGYRYSGVRTIQSDLIVRTIEATYVGVSQPEIETEKVVGILSESNETTALAVPVQTLVDFVSNGLARSQSSLWHPGRLNSGS